MLCNEDQPTVKILVTYHKPSTLLDNRVLVPIHGGRAISERQTKDGHLNNDDIKWLKEHMIGDDSGDNISHMNRNINEMTSVYWAWKNYEELGNPDFIGLAHYRSMLLMAPHPRYYKQSLTDMLGYPFDLYNQLRGVDFVSGEFYNWGHNVYQDFINMSKCTTDRELKHLEYLKEYIKNNHPQHYPILEQYLNQNEAGGQKSIFIMKKQYFFEYCEFMFDILFAMQKAFDSEGVNKGNCRVVGKAAEFLSSYYFYYLKNKGLSYKTFPIVNVPTFDTNITADALNYRKIWLNYQKCRLFSVITFGKTRDHYYDKKMVLKLRLNAVKDYLK